MYYTCSIRQGPKYAPNVGSGLTARRQASKQCDIIADVRVATAHPGYSFQNLINLLLKVHVEQSVSLIQNQMLQRFETETLQLMESKSGDSSTASRKIQTLQYVNSDKERIL